MRAIASCAFVFVFLSCLAQDTPAKIAACYKDKGIDEYIVELQKLQKKKGTHNPLPNNVCIFGWCRNTGAGPGDTKPKTEAPAPPADEKPKTSDTQPVDSVVSSSKTENLRI